jgi:aspartyl-tRNA(Asn)/glutamyl-tRNA(Gln) amidotransferase subunit B
MTAAAPPRDRLASILERWEPVIGIEVHCQLRTASKMFCGCSTAYDGAAPNTHVCPVCLGLPGALPVINRRAVELVLATGVAIEATTPEATRWDRKNYFYPDLPKGYQISQYETPVVQGGSVDFFVGEVAHRVQLTRAHLEEDAGKSLHGVGRGGEPGGGAPLDFQGDWSGIDLNRAGTPLLEIVTEPDMRSSAEAVEYARALHTLVVWLGICDGNMQEGSFRCDANVSVRHPGAPFGTRREIKNLNSFRFMQQAIDYEVQWQIDLIEDGGSVQQATVLFDAEHGETRAMRSKEDAHDYRYFPDPDLPPLAIGADWIERVRSAMPELPRDRASRFQSEYSLSAYDASMMTQSLQLAEYFEATAAASGEPKLAANWLMGEVSRRLNASGRDDIPVPPERLAALIRRVADRTISNAAARQLLDTLWDGDRADVDALIDARGLRQMRDAGELDRIVDEVISGNSKSVAEFRAGKDKAFNALVGQAMKASKGKADPAEVGAMLRKKLG